MGFLFVCLFVCLFNFIQIKVSIEGILASVFVKIKLLLVEEFQSTCTFFSKYHKVYHLTRYVGT